MKCICIKDVLYNDIGIDNESTVVDKSEILNYKLIDNIIYIDLAHNVYNLNRPSTLRLTNKEFNKFFITQSQHRDNLIVQILQ